MTATYYYITETGKTETVVSVPCGTTGKQVRAWTEHTIGMWEAEGWFTKTDGEGTYTFHKGLNDRAVMIVVGD